MELGGRVTAPDLSRGGPLSSRTRGGTAEPHGTLQRLSDVCLTREYPYYRLIVSFGEP